MEKNIVKETAKELGMTQKKLAERMGVSEDTMSNWSRGAVPVPNWAIEMFKLLKTEKKYNTIREFFLETE